MENYSAKETAEILGITERAVQKRCKILNVRKKDNKYFIDDELIDVWKAEILKANEPVREPTNEPQTNGSQTNLIIQSLEAEIETLKAELKFFKSNKPIEPQPKKETMDAIRKELQEIVNAGGNPNLLDEKIIYYEAIEREKNN